MTITERLSKYMQYKDLNANRVTVDAGLSVGLIGKSIKNNTGLNSDTIEKILHTYEDLNPEWFIVEIGEMIKTKSKENLTLIKGKETGKELGKVLNVENNLPSVNENRSDYQIQTPAVVTIDSHNQDNIALVPIPLSAGYLKGYNNPKFISKLPSYRMPGLNNGVFRMFEVQGNSMYPTIPNKSYVVGQFVENWIDDIKDNQVYAVISSDLEDGLIKRCLNKIKKYNNLICKSDNRRNFPTQNINPESIKEIWEIKLHLNFQLPDPADVYDRISDLEGEVYSLKDIVKKLK